MNAPEKLEDQEKGGEEGREGDSQCRKPRGGREEEERFPSLSLSLSAHSTHPSPLGKGVGPTRGRDIG